MNNAKKQHRNEPRKSEPRKPKALVENVISLRISDQEKRTLEKLTSKTSKSITDIMREALTLWSSKRRSLCMD
ncbi:MAG: ribbon-helix-helix protein, CopG family [Desulfuromonadaceae bacterium]|nr:ribbon-helix-helix protein, CopG family [Desulfuromonadaceae bacterium]